MTRQEILAVAKAKNANMLDDTVIAALEKNGDAGMKIEKAIESLQSAIDGHETRTEIYNLAITALREKAARENTKPLTFEQLKELLQLAAVDMRHNDNCDVCVFKDSQPTCECECLECGLDCECRKCTDGSNFAWQHAGKLKGLGVEV